MNCLDFMENIPSGTVELVIADPPYNIGKNYGNNSDKQSKNDYLKFISLFIESVERILTNNGSMIIYTGKQFYPYWYIEIEKYLHIINQIIWEYDSSAVQPKTKYGSIYEPIIYAAKSQNNRIFNSKYCMVDAKTGSKRKLIDYRKNPPKTYNSEKIAGDVWKYNRVRYKMPEYTKHPTQKPLSICDRIVKVHSNEKGIVYIPFAGSGSEIESCIKNHRNWIATEINEGYINDIIYPRIHGYVNTFGAGTPKIQNETTCQMQGKGNARRKEHVV